MATTRGKKAESRLESQVEVLEEKSVHEILKNVLTKLESCYSLIEEQSKKIEELKFEINQLTEKENVIATRSYSDVARNKPEHVLVVKPKKEQAAGKVKEDLKINVKPDDLQVGINIGKSIKDGGVIIKCADAQDLNTVKNKIQHKMGKNYDVKIPEKRKPRIIVIGIEDEKGDEAELIGRIIKQNKIPTGDDFHFKAMHKTKTRNGKFNLIIEVDPITFKYVLVENGEEKPSLHIGWKDCRVFEHFGVFRCFKCCGFNHEAAKCTESITCPLCSGNHKIDSCSSESKKCINCI